MVGGPGNTAGDVDTGRHGLAGEADLAAVGDPAGIDGNAGRADRAPDEAGEFLEHGEPLAATHATATSDDDLGLGHVELRWVGADFGDHFENTRQSDGRTDDG